MTSASFIVTLPVTVAPSRICGGASGSATRTVKVRSTVVNRGRTLKAEMFVNVAIATGTSRVLTVSQSAVHREGGETYVLVAKAKDQLERRPVVLGEDMGDAVEITSGLSAEDRVVSTGSILLKATTR